MNKDLIVRSKAICAQCGSQLSFSADTEELCVTCLLRTALSDEDIDHPVKPLRFDQYELVVGDDGAPVELGRGAMGVTYKAFDTNLRCEVALKVIHPRYLADEWSRARFLSEARAAAQLRHRNIASVFHLGSELGEYFYAMELVEGETIEDRVRRNGPIDCSTALDIALQITRALVAAGDRQFVHRDVKPSNVMLCTEADGAILAKLIDFGLVRAVTNQSASAGGNSVRTGFIGTPHFASPEQFAGQTTDGRSDIYSLGVTLWFMLTGKLPFAGTREEIQQQQVSEVLPLDHLKGIPRAVVDLIKRLLDVDPAKRPQSPTVLKEQLGKCMVVVDAAKQKQRRRFAYGALAAATLIIAALGASWILQRKLMPSGANDFGPGKSIAVLPFENLSDDKENAFFADGIQDDILIKLAKIADLKVINRTSVMQYRGKQDARQIGHALRASHVVEGTVRRYGDKVHINAELVDARTDTDVWAEEYERDLNGIFAIEAEVAQAIAGQLRAKVSAREKVAVREWPTKDLVAYDFYARATSLMDAALYSSHQKLLEAVELLNKAVARDPDFLLAYCKLAHAYDSIYVLGPDHTPVRLALAAAAVNTALRLNPNSSEAHLALAAHLYACLDYDRSRAELAVAGRALPNDHRIFEVAAYIDRRQGLWEASTRNFERAIELDPRNITILRYCASNYLFRREYRQAYAAYDRILVISPDDDVTRLLRARVDMWSRADTQPLHDAIEKISPKDPAGGEVVMPNRFFVALWERDPAAARRALALLGENVMIARNIGATQISPSLAEALIARMKGDASAAHTAFAAARVKQQEMVLLQPDFGPPLCVLGLIDAGLGQKEQALHEGRRALELTPVAKNSLDGADVLYFFAVICAWTGERDAAIEQLETLAKIPGGVSYGDLRLSPFWDQLRDDPRFARIVASLAPKEIANR